MTVRSRRAGRPSAAVSHADGAAEVRQAAPRQGARGGPRRKRPATSAAAAAAIRAASAGDEGTGGYVCGRPPPYHDPVLGAPGLFIQTLSGRRGTVDAAAEDIDSPIPSRWSNPASAATRRPSTWSPSTCDRLRPALRGATPDELMAALLHDAAEAYLGDLLTCSRKHRSELGAQFAWPRSGFEADSPSASRCPRRPPHQAARQGAARDGAARVQRGHLALARARRRRARPGDRAVGPGLRALREFTERYERIDVHQRG